MRDPFDSLSKIAQIHVPILIIHGDQDNVIPIEQGKELADMATARKRFVIVPNAGHVNIPDKVIIDSMQDFFTHTETSSIPNIKH